jgi:site-specific DNA recombinase
VIDDVVWERVSAVLRDPEIIAREVDRHRVDGGLDRDLDAIEKQIATLLDKQTRTARAIAAVDDDDAAAPLIAELMSLAARKKVAEAERVELRTRLADDAADVEKMKSLSEWCSRVNANLESLTYDERRMALDALGVHVHVYRPGTTDDGGNPYPRWVLTMNPITTGESFEFPLTRR